MTPYSTSGSPIGRQHAGAESRTLPKKATLLLLVQMGIVACTVAPIPGGKEILKEFANAKITLEQNFTDQDTEVVVFAKGLDDGLKQLTVSTTDGTVILSLSAIESTLGVREFSMESPEPGLIEVLEAYPAGTYVFEGMTIGGVRLKSTSTLSHELLDPTTIRFDKDLGTINWSSVPGADHYVIELEREVEGEDVVKLTLDVPLDVSSFPVPATMRNIGNYQVGIAAVSRGGNKTVVELEFTIDK